MSLDLTISEAMPFFKDIGTVCKNGSSWYIDYIPGNKGLTKVSCKDGYFYGLKKYHLK